jgi:LmbE family N-acetylglucosaminyl deacetylase
MEKQAALRIIQQLANGIDPHSGEVFRADSPYQHPDTVRALFIALRAVEGDGQPASKQRAAGNENAPQNAGKPWSGDEDKALASAFDAGKQIPELATQHQRSRFAIETRLAKLGKIAPPANMRGVKAASDTARYAAQH